MRFPTLHRFLELRPPLHGTVAEGFETVRDAFDEMLESGEEKGGAVCVTHEGRVVVDLWGGYARRGSLTTMGIPWDRDALTVVFSATKGLTALVYLQLFEQGAFQYDDKVTKYWPEFGQADKTNITIRTLLNHQAGLVGLDDPLDMNDVTDPARWGRVVRAMERQRPAWPPGSGQGYHAVTYGLYAAELINRIAPGFDFSSYFRDRISRPLEADLWVGAPPSIDARVAELYPPSTASRLRGMAPEMVAGSTAEGHVGRSFVTPDSLTRKAFLNPAVEKNDVRVYNRPPARRTPLLWASAVGNARGLARVYAPLANGGKAFGVRLVKEETLAPVYERQGWSTKDSVLGKPLGWSQGFLKEEPHVFCPNEASFGHAGMGGSLGWADPTARISFGYVTNTMDWRIRSRRCIALCQALYRAPALRDSLR